MYGERHNLIHEFPEFRSTIQYLKVHDRGFSRLLGEYDVTDKRIYGIEQQMQPVTDAYLEDLKKRRLKLKDQLYTMLIHHNSIELNI
jgi:uncharacterized protein YdcH (DUF465 family)